MKERLNMKKLCEAQIFECSAKALWEILSNVSRCDWVPTIKEITLEGDCRLFEMEGMGTVKERILLLDNEFMRLQYSAIETPTPIQHHLATMQILSIDEITIEGDCRIFEMEGMGLVKERILLLDNEAMRLQYSAIETPAPIQHHLATMQILSIDESLCKLEWTTEIEPEAFAEAVHQGMLISIEGIKKIIR